MFGIHEDAVYGADFLALRRVVVTDTFRAQLGIDDVDLLAGRNRLIGALRLAHVAVDAFVGDEKGHV
jgi:hypothetical protein